MRRASAGSILTDDLTFKHDFKTIDGSLPQALRFVLAHTGLKSGLAERFRALVNMFLNSGKIERELIETRCHRGAEIARKMRFSEGVASGIQNLDEHWDGGGQPLGLRGDGIPVYARIALMAQVVDVFQTAQGAGAAMREVEQPRRRLVRSRALRRVRARRVARRVLGHAALRRPAAGDLRARAGAAQRRWSTRTTSTTSPPPSPR